MRQQEENILLSVLLLSININILSVTKLINWKKKYMLQNILENCLISLSYLTLFFSVGK